ncbi:hypothetical protein J7443_01915 [Tropicibacter sp. R15_0]|nr:hypothetical protein [Tropicibacter sp. R15_0]
MEFAQLTHGRELEIRQFAPKTYRPIGHADAHHTPGHDVVEDFEFDDLTGPRANQPFKMEA